VCQGTGWQVALAPHGLVTSEGSGH
jgi:hypothetical protein